MIQQAATGTFIDSDVEDGYVRTQPSEELYGMLDFFMSKPTFQALLRAGYLPEVYSELEARPVGLHLIPASILRSDERDELQRGLSLVDPSGSEFCEYPPCILPADLEVDGFRLCASHGLLLPGWDQVGS